MKKPIEMIISIKKPWVDHASELLAMQEAGTWRPSNKDLVKFWDSTSEAFLRRETEAVKPLFETWLQTYFAAEMDTGKLTTDIRPILIPLLSAFEHACILAAGEHLSEGEQLRLYDEIVPLFYQFYDLAATLELGMYIHELQRREEVVRDKVQRLDDTRSSFINTAAHELKTPLTLIEGYTEMLVETMKESDLDPDYEVLVRGIKTGTDKMRKLIDELIDVSLVDNQMLSLYYQPVRIGDLVSEIADSLQERIVEKSISFEMKPFDGAQKVTYADEERLEQAFMHVIRNAIQFTPEGGSIHIDGRILPGFIEISCADTGIGVGREDQATIFEKFGRVPSSSARHDVGDPERESGAGLGLHLTKGILEAHGGTIWVESPGRDIETCPGSTFHIMIPLREQAPELPTIRQFASNHLERFE